MMHTKTPILKPLLLALEDIQAIDTTVIDVSDHTTITDVMIICTGRSSRHVKAIAQHIMEHMKTLDFAALSCTGLETSDWALVDFGDAVVHIMQPDSRSFYNLEGLWQHQTPE